MIKQIENCVCFLLLSTSALISTALGSTIINGRNATDGEVPFQVSIYSHKNNFFCGGSILNEYWVITAGHCIPLGSTDPMMSSAYESFQSGGYSINGSIHYNTLDVSKGNIVQIEHTYMYPVDPFSKNDIGLIRTATPMQLGQQNAKRAKLPKESDFPTDGDTLVVSGWGKLTNGFNPKSLQIVNVPFMNETLCSKVYTNSLVISTMFCTAPHRGPCFGDSGGPATVNGVLHGLVSFGGMDCKTYPSVYTRVAHYIPWIQQITGIEIE